MIHKKTVHRDNQWTLYEGCPYRIEDSRHFSHFYVLLPGGGSRICNSFEDAVAELESCVADDIAWLTNKLQNAQHTQLAVRMWRRDNESPEESAARAASGLAWVEGLCKD